MNLPPYDKFPFLAAEKIVLRQIMPTDLEDIIEISFYDGKQAITAAEAQEMLDKINADYQRGDSIHWGIADKENNKIVGTCGYYRGFTGGTGELGFVLRPAFQGQGFMTDAIKTAAAFGLRDVGLQRVIAITGNQNTKAIQVLKRSQFEKTKELDDDMAEFEYFENNRI